MSTCHVRKTSLFRADFVCVAYEKPLIRHFVPPSPHALRLRGEGKLDSCVRYAKANRSNLCHFWLLYGLVSARDARIGSVLRK